MVNNNCEFARTGEDGQYKCVRCGRIVEKVSVLPIFCECADRPTARCRHLGPSTRTADCPTCQGRVQLKIFACELHAECTLQKKLGSLACCATCEKFEAKE